jgi:hypothetical protein
MSQRWRIIIEAWPHSTSKGSDEDRKAVGGPVHYFEVTASNFDQACLLANCIAMGMQSSPAIWQAPITGIHTIPESGPASIRHT